MSKPAPPFRFKSEKWPEIVFAPEFCEHFNDDGGYATERLCETSKGDSFLYTIRELSAVILKKRRQLVSGHFSCSSDTGED